MSSTIGTLKYEYLMSVRRWGLWVAFFVAAIPYSLDLIDAESVLYLGRMGLSTWQLAGQFVLSLNFFLPVVAGIAMADRLARDSRLGIGELLRSTSLTRQGYIVGKYLGAVLSVLTPALVITLLGAAGMVALGIPVEVLAYSLAAYLILIVPCYVFIGAFSIACPAIMPVRVYQVLFTGYWFWGNFLNSDFILTLSDTILTPSGRPAAGGFFSIDFGMSTSHASTLEGYASIVALVLSAAIALFVLDRYLQWREAAV